MKQEDLKGYYEHYSSADELTQSDRDLLRLARQTTANAYAPYSGFRVGAAAILSNGKIVTGSNQENASFPAGICAEGVLLAATSSQYPEENILTIAISYNSDHNKSDHPVAPCGVCRQAIQEYQQRGKNPIRLILGGMEGSVFIVPDAGWLLPLAFTDKEFVPGK